MTPKIYSSSTIITIQVSYVDKIGLKVCKSPRDPVACGCVCMYGGGGGLVGAVLIVK